MFQLDDCPGHCRFGGRGGEPAAERQCAPNSPVHRSARRGLEPPALNRAQLLPVAQTVSVDLRVSRSFQLPGTAEVEALVEAFNLFNRINYSSENTTLYTIGGTATAPTLVYNPLFGSLTNTNNGVFSPRPREVQLGVKFSF